MLIVSDTSPITNLITINKLDLLQSLFKEIIIPETVYNELSDYENQKYEIDSQNWIIVKSVNNKEAIEELKDILDAGEAEAIVLADELKAELLIIDERKGRKIAESRGLIITGLIGILIKAYQKGLIQDLRTTLDQLIEKANFRISKELYSKVLEKVS